MHRKGSLLVQALSTRMRALNQDKIGHLAKDSVRSRLIECFGYQSVMLNELADGLYCLHPPKIVMPSVLVLWLISISVNLFDQIRM